jgi:tetratricopeptide (TPR) repeat protein
MKKIFVFLTILLLSTGYAQNFDNNRFLLAQNLEQAGEYSKAREIYESLYRTDPGNTVYFQKLNDVYFELKLYDNVVSLISPKIAQSPDDLQLAGTLGKAWCLKGEEQKAFDLWDALLARIPMKSQAARIFAGICMEVRMVDKTISYLNKAKSFAGNDHSIGLELLNIYLQTMQYQNAAREAAEILGKAPDLISQVEVRVNPYLDRKELVTVLITEIEKANLKNQSGYRLLQKLYLEANDYENAFSDAKKLDDQQKRQGIDVYQLGILLYSRGAYEKAAEVFGYVQETYETSVLAASAELYGVRSLDAAQTMKLRSGINDWKPEKKEGSIPLGHRQEIISRYRRILSAPKPQDVLVEAKLRLASIYYEAGQFDSARYYAADIIRFNNMSHSGPEANFLMVKMLLKDRKADSCLTFYDNIIACPATAAPQRSAAKIGKGLLWCAAGNFEKARDLFRDVSSTPRDDNATDA